MRTLARHLLFLTTLACAPAHAASLLLDKTVSGFASPESVTVAGKDVFVSNLGEKLEPFAKDGDGFISRLDRAGNIKTLRWISGLDAPKGLIALGEVLYVADIDRVLGFRLRDGKRVFELDLSAAGAKFLNGFARYDSRRLLLSDSGLNAVFLVDVKAGKAAPLQFDTPPKGPNGLKLRGNVLVVAEWGADMQPNGGLKTYLLKGGKDAPSSQSPGSPTIDLASSGGGSGFASRGPSLTATLDQTHTPEPNGYFDGVVDMGANRWLFSNWVKFEPAGMLQVLDARKQTVTPLPAPVTLAGPADLFLDDQGKLWVPGMLEGKVHRFTLRR